MSAPIVQGWCPGAHRPMMSGDGLVVRVRPRLARLEADQALGLCDLADRFGNGSIDLTNRANLQLRGVEEEDHQPLLKELAALNLLDAEPGIEIRRNILVTPLYQAGDLTARLTHELIDRLVELPALPAKFGFAIDTGRERLLASDSADIRLETGAGGLILRADGCETGRSVTETDAIDHVIALAMWFAETYTPETRRMAHVIDALPQEWKGCAPGSVGAKLQPGRCELGALYGAAFGSLPARKLYDLIEDSGACALRVTPWRLILLEGGAAIPAPAFVEDGTDPLMTTDACPGAPFCPQAQAETRDIARALASRVSGRLHVSGCSKGCARMGPADITLVGANGRFDLVKQGRAGDEPSQRGLDPETLMTMDFT
ncbi:cobalamin biosynthesis protein CobG [Ruegeria sp. HKCCD6228]|uniref:cobalamin biosynthesis protein CobG n=1 Tax=unclassified Ruegeria TaxID=2625375 RepID=UPI0014896913|nr:MULTISPECIES: cobalamin biosynthesis protein CobG [unclassified Ruegeria]NOD98859.1 cobalamin biosynthesis protein CobG [Ruegeria sp. HKCCD6228]